MKNRAFEPTKNNPFYYYLKNQKKMGENKTDMHGDHYLILPLKPIAANSEQVYQGEPLNFIEHHLTVFQNNNSEVGFQSYSHYSRRFDSHLIHAYFSENGAFITATIENTVTGEIKQNHDILEQDFFSIHLFIENEIQPWLMDLHEQHLLLIKQYQNNYVKDLDKLKDSLFDSSEDVLKNLNQVTSLIHKISDLKLISFKQKFTNETLSYLNGFARFMQEQIQSRKTSKTKVKAKVVKHHGAIEDTSVNMTLGTTEVLKPRSTSNKSPEQSFLQELDKLEQAIEHYNHELFLLESSEENISIKMQKFSETFRDFERHMNAQALILSQELDSKSLELQARFKKADLNVTLFQEKFDQLGIGLLLECLDSEALLTQYANCLKVFVGYLNHSHLKKMIESKNISAIKFLLDHGEFNINDVQVKHKKSKLSPLSFAYKLNNLELFETLLNYKASPKFFYGDMPLAHVLLQLDAAHPFYQNFMRHYDMAMQGNPRLYDFLCKAIEYKLQDTKLSAAEIESLENAKTRYKSSMLGYVRDFELTSSLRDNVVSVSSRMNPHMLSALRSSPEVLGLANDLNEKAKKLHGIFKKQRIAFKAEKRCQVIYEETRKMLDGGLVELMQKFTEADVCDSLRLNLKQVEASIDFFQLKNKANRTKNEDARLQSAVAILHEANESSPNQHRQLLQQLKSMKDGLEIIMEQLNKIENLFSPNMKELSKIRASEYSDEYDEVDFLNAAMAEDETVPSSSSRAEQPHSIDFIASEDTIMRPFTTSGFEGTLFSSVQNPSIELIDDSQIQEKLEAPSPK